MSSDTDKEQEEASERKGIQKRVNRKSRRDLTGSKRDHSAIYTIFKKLEKIADTEEVELLIEHWAEEIPIFLQLIRWFIISTLAGVAIGTAVRIFLLALEASARFMKVSLQGYYYLLPIAFLGSTWVINRFAREAAGHGTEKVIEAVHKYSGHIRPRVLPIKVIATILTIAVGGSAGKEGPSAQIGAAIASMLADLLRFNDEDRKKLVICGISAAFASVFGTPIAGALFGIEILTLGSLMYEVIFPSFIAGISSYYVTKHVLGQKYFFETLNINNENIAVIISTDKLLFIKSIGIGILVGIFAIIFIEMLEMIELWTEHSKVRKEILSAVAGLILVCLTIFLGERYLGLGLESIREALSGKEFSLADGIWKMIFTSITLTFGSGGIITPILFIGSTIGNALGPIFHLNRAMSAMIGLSAMIAASTNAPIAASMFAVELFGASVTPYASVASIVAFLVVGYKSVYPSQVVAIAKARGWDIPLGREVLEVERLLAKRYINKKVRRRLARHLLSFMWHVREPFRFLKAKVKHRR